MNDQQELPQATHRLYAETMEGATAVLELRRTGTYSQRFLTMFTAAASTLAGLDRPPVYFRALCHCLAVLDAQQWRSCSARSVAEACRISQASAERALAQLEADQVVLTRGKTANLERRLSNRLAWTSSANAWAKAQPDPELRDGRGR